MAPNRRLVGRAMRLSVHAPVTAHPGGVAGIGLALLLLATGLGSVLTGNGPVATGELGLDQQIAAHRLAPLVWAAQVANVAFGPAVAPVLLLVGCVVVAMRNRWAAVVLGAATVIGWFSVELGKLFFARPRPPMGAVHALVHETGADSYPSGHTAFAAASLAGVLLALRMTGRRSWWAWVAGLPLVVGVAWSRLYLGAHYLGDVVGSFLYVVGTVLVFSAGLSGAIQRWAGGDGRPAPFAPTRVAADDAPPRPGAS